MAKRNAPPTITCQASHTRNSYDTSYQRDARGRLCLLSNKKGVAFRIGVIVTFLANKPGSGVEAITEHLRSFDRSYNSNDVSQPVKQMLKVGIVKRNGRFRDTTYQLTPQGKRIWERVRKDVRWV